jgi:glutaconate CoA-transferase, subunit A
MIVDLDRLVAMIPDGAKIAIPKDTSGAAIAATCALIERGVRGLYLVCVPVGGLQADMLIGAGCVATIETSAVSLGEYGPAPRFAAALKDGSLKILDSTCPAIYAGLQAAEKGIPFIPLRGLIGSDLVAQRTDWRLINNPFAPGDEIVALAAIRPDYALFHAPLADRYGNVFIGRERELLTMAHASVQTLVTVESITDENLFDDEARAGSVIPSLYVSHIAQAKQGAWPLGLARHYPDDSIRLAEYADAARSVGGFARYIRTWGSERSSAAENEIRVTQSAVLQH